MEHKVPFEEGSYLAEQAYLVTPNDMAVVLEDVVVKVYVDQRGIRQMNGAGFLMPLLLVRLHEESDTIDLVLDFGQDLKYRLKAPLLQSGKVFAADVKASLKFTPTTVLTHVPEAEYATWFKRLVVVNDPDD